VTTPREYAPVMSRASRPASAGSNSAVPDGVPERLLAGLGVSAGEEEAYRALLRSGPADLSDLSRRTGRPTAELRRALPGLEDKGLVSRLTGATLRLVATSPHVALDALAARRHEEIARARGAIDVLAGETQHATGSRPEELLEVVTGREAVGHSFMQLNLAARSDVRALVRPPFAADLSQAPVTQDTALRRGVRVRGIYDISAFETAHLLEWTHRLVDEGEEARIGVVPIKLVVVDSKIAMLPLTSGDADAVESAVVIHPSSLLDALISLFEMLWRAASPLGWTAEGGAAETDGLVASDREILSLLSAA